MEIYIGSGKVALKSGNDFKFTRHKTGTMYRINGKMIAGRMKEQVGSGRVMGRIVDGILVVKRKA